MAAHARGSRFLWFVTAVTAAAGFLYGYDTGIIAGALLHITAEYRLDHQAQELVAAAILVGAVLGALLGGRLVERVGRRRTVTLLAGVYAAGAVLAALAPTPPLLALARVFLGLAVGGSSQAVPMYVAELAPARGRGHYVCSFNVAIGLGIVSANLVAAFAPESVGWRWMVGGAAVPAAGLLALSFLLPESPRWLVGRGDVAAARRELARVRADGSPLDAELADIREMADREGRAAVRGWHGLAQPWVRPAVVAALGVAAFTQLTGIEMMIYYAPTMLTGVGFSQGSALHVSLGLGVVYAVMTAVGLAIVDRVGRRRLSLVTLPGAAVCLFVLGAVIDRHPAGGGSPGLVAGCLLGFMFFSAGGLQVVGWLTGSEMYPLAVRGAGTSAQAAMVWGSNLVITGTALTLMAALGAGGSMWLYAALNVLAFAFIWRYVPETAGRSLEEIERSLRAGTFLPATARPHAPRVALS